MYSRNSTVPLPERWKDRTEPTTPTNNVIVRAVHAKSCCLHNQILGPFQAIAAVANHQYLRRVAPSDPQSSPPMVRVISPNIMDCRKTTRICRPVSLKYTDRPTKKAIIPPADKTRVVRSFHWEDFTTATSATASAGSSVTTASSSTHSISPPMKMVVRKVESSSR